MSHHLASATFVAKSSACPTEPWQRMQEISVGAGVRGGPHRLHDRVVAAPAVGLGDRRGVFGVARIGSAKVCVVK